MMSKLINHSFFILFLFSAIMVNGQFNYKRGYVITNDNDTLSGKINDGGSIRNYKHCLFKAEGTTKALKFSPDEIKAYHFIDGRHYTSMKVLHDNDYEFVFVENLLEGKLNLYYDMKNSNSSFFIEKEEAGTKILAQQSMRIVQNPSVFQEEERNTGVKMDVFKDTLISLFSDYPDLHSQVRNVDYNKKSLINITKAYLEETCEEEDCILYESDLEKYRNRFGFYSGIRMSFISFEGYEDVLTGSLYSTPAKSDMIISVPVGVFYTIPLVLLNERLSFQVEMVASQMNYQQSFPDEDNFVDNIQIKSTTLNIPVLLKYQLQGSFVSPSVSVGRSAGFLLNSSARYTNSDQLFLHNKQPKGWIFELGLDYKIKPKLFFFSNIRFQPTKNLIVTKQFQKVNYSSVVDDLNFNVKYKTNLISVLLGIKF